MKVYLAGGMKSGWQQKLIDYFSNLDITLYDPTKHRLESPELYSPADIYALKQSDIIFIYMEETNPSGMGASFEAGYAYAESKLIILVDEKSPNDEKFARQFAMVSTLASVKFNNLRSGMDYLRAIRDMEQDDIY
jgi:nucleoside 2-deoxyribosyltransferase